MGKLLKQAVHKNYAFWITLGISIFLILGGALVPPPFIIDNSIFVAVGELMGFAALGILSKAIEQGLDARVKHGDTTIEVGDFNKKEEIEID